MRKYITIINFTKNHLLACIFNSYKYSKITLQNRTNASQQLAILLCHLTIISPCFYHVTLLQRCIASIRSHDSGVQYFIFPLWISRTMQYRQCTYKATPSYSQCILTTFPQTLLFPGSLVYWRKMFWMDLPAGLERVRFSLKYIMFIKR